MQLRPLLDKFDSLASWLQSPLLLAIRLYWGFSFAQSGWGKLTNLEKTTGFFESLNLPFPKVNAIMAGTTELVGGALLALGLFARPVSLPLIFTMLVAFATADNEAPHAILGDLKQIFSGDKTGWHALSGDLDKFVTAAPFLFLFAAVIVLAFGPGRISIDGLWRGKGGKA